MEFTMELLSGEFLNTVSNLEKSTAKILKQARLSEQQRVDLEIVLEATKRFQTFASENAEIIDNFTEAEPAALQHVRHELLNHLNIIAGFTRIMVRDLPDNLLLEMVTIRNINETGQSLIDKISDMR